MMKNQDYSKIKSIEELHRARDENNMRLVQAQHLLTKDFLSLRESLRISKIIVDIFDNSLSFVSQFYFFRRGYRWLHSLLQKYSKEKNIGKRDNNSLSEIDKD